MRLPCLSNKHLYVPAGKSKNRKAIAVPLNEMAMSILLSQQGKHSINVFTYNGKPIRQANNHAWKQALKRAGIINFRWHDLRHTWATWQRQSGTPTHELQQLGGWKTGAMVERYAHIDASHLVAAASRIDILTKPLENQLNNYTGE